MRQGQISAMTDFVNNKITAGLHSFDMRTNFGVVAIDTTADDYDIFSPISIADWEDAPKYVQNERSTTGLEYAYYMRIGLADGYDAIHERTVLAIHQLMFFDLTGAGHVDSSIVLAAAMAYVRHIEGGIWKGRSIYREIMANIGYFAKKDPIVVGVAERYCQMVMQQANAHLDKAREMLRAGKHEVLNDSEYTRIVSCLFYETGIEFELETPAKAIPLPSHNTRLKVVK